MTSKTGILSAAFIAAACMPAAAGNYGGGLPGAFLENAAGARALALGGALTAIAEGTPGLFYNPAGLAEPRTAVVSVNQVSLFEGGSLQDYGVSRPFKASYGAGLDYVRFSLPGIDMRDGSNALLGETHDVQTGLLFGVGYKPVEGLAIGISGKHVTHSLGDAAATGGTGSVSSSVSDIDLGAILRLRQLRLGVAFRNILSSGLKRAGGSDQLPRITRLGAGMQINKYLLAALDAVNKTGAGTDIQGGIEFRPAGFAALRAGWDGSYPAIGAGLNIGQFRADYAMMTHEELGPSRRLSFSYIFSGSNMNTR